MVDGKNWKGMTGKMFKHGKTPVTIVKSDTDEFTIYKAGKVPYTYSKVFVTNKKLKRLKLTRITKKQYDNYETKKWRCKK